MMIVNSSLSGVVICGQASKGFAVAVCQEFSLAVPAIIWESGAGRSFTRNANLKTIDTINRRAGFYF